MKKFSVIVLAGLYLITTSGVLVHHHYCMGRFADWSIGQSIADICNFCGMTLHEGEDNNCCKDEFLLVQNNTDQLSNDMAMLAPVSSEWHSPLIANKISTAEISIYYSLPDFHHPPPLGPSGIERCILHQVFRL